MRNTHHQHSSYITYYVLKSLSMPWKRYTSWSIRVCRACRTLKKCRGQVNRRVNTKTYYTSQCASMSAILNARAKRERIVTTYICLTCIASVGWCGYHYECVRVNPVLRLSKQSKLSSLLYRSIDSLPHATRPPVSNPWFSTYLPAITSKV